MTKRVLSIIPARGGSKGLPRKNILKLAGKPLIAWTIEASLNSKFVTKTIVSSDDKEILDIAKDYGSEILLRPKNLATDLSSSESVVTHALNYLESVGEEFDFVALLQPTSPLRNYKDIDKAFKVMVETKSDAVISVCEFDNKILKSFIKAESGYLNAISNKKYLFMSRQNLPKVFLPNGAIYIINSDAFKENNTFLTDKTINYSMPESRSIDIDNKKDIDLILKSLIG